MFQKLEKNTLGYKLLDFGTHYSFHGPKGIFNGNLSQISNYAVLKLGFDIADIELAVLEMNEAFDNVAEFGVMKKFLYTYDLNDKQDFFLSH